MSSHSSFQLLVDAEAFWDALEKDLKSARREVLLQTLSFEGDRVGQTLTSSLLSLAVPDIRLLIDTYTKFVLNDRFLYTPKNYFHPELKKERVETRRLIRELRQRGIQVKFTVPVGPFFIRAAARDHKKIIVIDGSIAYIGGINFSEHNFQWHDMMLRMEHPVLADFLREDFLLTWEGETRTREMESDGIRILSMDGRDNPAAFRPVLELVENAHTEIWVHSPYLSFPFLEALVAARRRGVAVRILSPQKNNRLFLRRYIQWEAHRYGLELYFLPNRMSHLKAMLVDGEYLVMGSSNFDYLSYHVHPEIVAIISNRDIVSQFCSEVLEKDLQQSIVAPDSIPEWQGKYVRLKMMFFGKLFSKLAKM